MSTFAERIRALRTARGQSQSQMARLIGLRGDAFAKWENARETHPIFTAIPRVADALGVSIEWLVAGRGEPPAELAGK